MKTKSKIAILFIALLVCSFVLISLMCSKDDKPEIAGCNSIKYNGETYNNVGCAPGIRSFDISYGDGASFHVECSGGCVSAVSVAEGGLGKTIVGPVE